MSVVYGINANTYDLLVDSNNKHTGEELGNSIPYVDLNILTSGNKKLAYKIMRLIINIIKVRKGKDDFKNYKMKDGSIVSYRLASDVFDFLDSEEELLSDDRYGHCYLKSIQMTTFIKDSNILFGLTKIGDYQRMHAVVEFNLNDRLCVFDWTQNLVMPKDQYVKLFDFNIYNSIIGNDAKRIIELCQSKGINTSTSIVLAFGEELENDIKRLSIK